MWVWGRFFFRWASARFFLCFSFCNKNTLPARIFQPSWDHTNETSHSLSLSPSLFHLVIERTPSAAATITTSAMSRNRPCSTTPVNPAMAAPAARASLMGVSK